MAGAAKQSKLVSNNLTKTNSGILMRSEKIRTVICIKGKQENTVISFYWHLERIQSWIETLPFCNRKWNRGCGRKHIKYCFKVKDALKSFVTCLIGLLSNHMIGQSLVQFHTDYYRFWYEIVLLKTNFTGVTF